MAGVGPQAHHTPQEFGVHLAQALPQVRGEIELVVSEYAVATYGRRRGQPSARGQSPSAGSGQALARAWSRLRWSLLWRATLGRLAGKTR
ncbi:MAG: hypothetical protein HY330_00615 [Chloroflexi bacterium]|nr:hypothetical protein [Chloroflexota bacterium]